ncbi:MAG: sulfurtransferase TusA family protein [Candidatus Heimdallarchaeaceae archaeon]|jgi:TusA-related sulfurtransferase
MTEYDIAEEVDSRGSFCPGPMMDLIKAIRQLEVGDLVSLLSTDEGSRVDVPAWVEKAQHELVEIIEEDGYDRYIVRKLH